MNVQAKQQSHRSAAADSSAFRRGSIIWLDEMNFVPIVCLRSHFPSRGEADLCRNSSTARHSFPSIAPTSRKARSVPLTVGCSSPQQVSLYSTRWGPLCAIFVLRSLVSKLIHRVAVPLLLRPQEKALCGENKAVLRAIHALTPLFLIYKLHPEALFSGNMRAAQ